MPALVLPLSEREAAAGYHHGDLRRALVDAALDQLADGDNERLGLRELARRVGVSSAAPYRHFKNREELLAAVAAEGFARLRATMQMAAAGKPAELHLAAMGRAYVRFARQHAALFRLMFSSEVEGAPDLREAALDAIAPLAVAAGREAGRRDPVEVAHGAWGLAHGLAHLALSGLLPEEPDRADPLVTAITAGYVAGLRTSRR